MNRRWISFILGIAILTSLVPSAFAEGTEEDYCGCFESQELAEAAAGALIEEKLGEMQAMFAATSNQMIIPSNGLFTRMPSVGNVHMLVLPIAYTDHPDTLKNYYDDETYRTNVFFNEYDPDLSVYDQSVRGYYQQASGGELDITGTLLPVYMAPEPGTYYEKNPSEFSGMIGDALEHYVDEGLDLSEFDNDGDGVVDALVVHSLAQPSVSSIVWRNVIRTLNNREIGNCLVNTYAHTTRENGTLQGVGRSFCHEIGHLLGMQDHYDQKNDCYLDYALNELMGGNGKYINAYYKFLFDWISPIVLTNEDSVGRMELIPVEKYVSGDSEEKTAAILIPNPANLPFTEFFIVEYRTGEMGDPWQYKTFENAPGIVIWHCDTYYNPSGKIKPYYSAKSFIKPVYKSGTETYGEKDIYLVGDEFSSDSAANSNFYNGDQTGAYLRVEEITPEKAVLQAGFREPNLGPAPVIEISKPSPTAIRSDEVATFTITVTDGTEEIPFECNRERLRYHFYTTGTLQGTEVVYWRRNPTPVEIKDVFGTKGEGTIWVDIPPGAVQYNAKDSNPVKSEAVYIDNTPPEITLKGENPQRIPLGSGYKELGAIASDNLDPDIADKLQINATQVNTNAVGTYKVTYSVTDHVRYTTTAERTVIVEPHTHQYSDEWKSDGSNHWHECSCGDKADFAEHTAEIDPGKEATCTQPGKTEGSHCSVCERVLQVQTVIQPLEHSYSVAWSQDETNHWHECSRCQEKKDLAPHAEDTGTIIKQPTEEETGSRTFSCVACGREMRTETIPKLEPSHTHEYSEDWKSDGTSHWHECECGDRADMIAHTPETVSGIEATCTQPGLTEESCCSICGRILVAQTEIPAKGHTLGTDWSSDAADHWHECTVCHEKADQAPHTWDGGTVTTAPTSTKPGVRTYTCTVCKQTRTETVPATGGGSSSGGSSGGSYSSGGSTATRDPEYTVTLPQKTEGGSIKAEPQKAVKGSKVTLTVESTEGYELEEITVKDKKGNELTLEKMAGKYAFSMPGSNVEVTAAFRKVPVEEIPPSPPPKEEDPQPRKPELPFTDVPEKAWYYDAVAEVYDRGIMTGLSETRFAPELPASRGMVVTMLYRMAGEPPIRGKTAFTDISGKEYYAQAVAWATVQGLVNGYGDGTFRPNEEISREQLVTILYRYAERKGYDMTQQADLSGFFDVGQISPYAREAMSWAKAAGLVNGTDWGGIDPRGAAGRGQIAAILVRLYKSILN